MIRDETIDCTNISLRFIQSSAEPKQIHGLVQNILPAAISSALSQALANIISDVPLQPETLFKKGFNQEKMMYGDPEQTPISGEQINGNSSDAE